MILRRVRQSLARRHSLVMVVLVALLLVIGAAHANAQGGTELLEGIPVVGTISAEAPAAIYTLNAAQGVLLSVQVVGLSDGMGPELSLLSTTQQPLATSDYDPLGMGNDARLTYVVQEGGPHFVLVAGTPGSFVIRYSTIQPQAVTPLLPGVPATEEYVGGSPRAYSFTVDASQGVSLIVATPPGTSLPFAARVYDADGQPVGALFGDAQDTASLLIPPGFGNYTVVVSALGAEARGQIMVSVSIGIGGSTPLGPTATPVSGGNTGTQCLATPQRTDIAVNLRGGPDTSFPVVGSIPAGGSFPIIARDPSGAWYGGRLPSGQVAWVFSGVVSLSGPCQQLQVFATYAPSATYTVTPTGTGTPTTTVTATTTSATATPTVTTTATQQVAPPDTDLNDPLNIALGASVSVTEYVSYPDGDTTDQVQYEVTGMSTDPATSDGKARLVIQATCTGSGTDQVTFYVGGLTYGCGQTIVDQEVTYETRYGLVVINAIGGQGTYVQWTLTGTATRVQ